MFFLLFGTLISFFWGTPIQGQDLLELTQKVTKSIEPSEKSDFHLKFIQTSTSSNRMDIPQSIEVEIKKSSTSQQMISSQIEAFMDEKDAFIVYKEPKRIFVMKDANEAKAQMNNFNMKELLGQLWKTASIQEMSTGNPESRRLKIIPSKEMQKATRIIQVDLIFNSQSLKLQKTSLLMEENSPVKRVDFEYLIIDHKPSLKLFKEAKSNVLDSNGKLLKKYQGYTIQNV